MTLMGVCGRVDKVTASEILDYSTYTGDYEPMGYGKPAEFRALLEIPEILIMAWGGTVPMMAAAMEVELDDITTTYDKWVTPNASSSRTAVLEPDTVAAVHFTINGMLNGEARIVLEHVNRITNDVAPEWPRGRIAENDVYRVDIEGSPTIRQETILRDAGGDPVAGGCFATGMRALERGAGGPRCHAGHAHRPRPPPHRRPRRHQLARGRPEARAGDAGTVAPSAGPAGLVQSTRMTLPAPRPDGTHIVTGASAGIGVELARQLATPRPRPHPRRPPGGPPAALAAELADVHPIRVEVITADLTDEGSRRGSPTSSSIAASRSTGS